MMKKPIVRKIKKITSKETRQELARAHAMVALLAVSLIAILVAGSQNTIQFEPGLSLAAATLLGFVAIFSLVIAYRFRK